MFEFSLDLVSGDKFQTFTLCSSAWPTEEFNPALEKMTRRVEHITNLWASSSKGESDKFMVSSMAL